MGFGLTSERGERVGERVGNVEVALGGVVSGCDEGGHCDSEFACEAVNKCTCLGLRGNPLLVLYS